MAKKTVDYSIVPKDLKNHPFYGYELNEEQSNFRDAIWDDEKLIVFCNAKAGTGKTFVATGTADLLVKYNKYKKLVYVCAPVQEHKQGYLAGSLADKSMPYFEPFYQALDNIGINQFTAFVDDIEKKKNGTGYIECMTHTFLRGCNFKDSVVIIDECQNFYTDELKKVLTRCSDSCKVICIGHTGQIDLYSNPDRSGFATYIEHFKDDERTAVCELTHNYRGWISQHADSIDD